MTSLLNRGIPLLIATVSLFGSTSALAGDVSDISYYDETAYTQYVADMMSELDRLYIEFSKARGRNATAANAAREAFLTKAHELMHNMNARYDKLDPKAGAAMSETETLVNIHALIMLVDILSETQLENLAAHPYID